MILQRRLLPCYQRLEKDRFSTKITSVLSQLGLGSKKNPNTVIVLN